MPQETAVPPSIPRFPGIDAAATPLIGLGLGLTGLLWGVKPRLAAYPLVITALAALIFRDPPRRTPLEHLSLFSPADGTVVAVEELYEHRYLHTDAVRLTITTRPFDVPVQRSPVAGTVRYLASVEGEVRPLWQAGDVERNSHLYLGIEADWGPLLLTLYSGSLSPRIVCHVAEGDTVAAGSRLATLRFGARVDLIIPADVVAVLPNVGTMLRAGTSRIGRLAE
ncbi:MAG: phosphatidylserine decarboxylase [Roseiflexaceae bacterium]|nr:phosphatidylserine decarboxylase [Roseiflexaceae bacterium]